MTTLFISDLHLSDHEPERIQLAVDFIKDETANCNALYILGDLFNTWLGDDIVPAAFVPLVEQLQKLHQSGVAIYLMVGNRDFMMGKHFAQQIGAQLLGDTQVIDLYGTPTLLMHGDTLCIDDVDYQRYRKWTRSKLLQWLFLYLPTSYRQKISDKIKQKSRQKKQTKSAMIMDVNPNEVVKVMQQFGVTQLIHGHTHRPAIHHLTINNQAAKRIVLGDWQSTFSSFLVCDDNQLKLNDPRVE